MLEKPKNRENIKIQFEDFKNTSKLSLENVASKMMNVSQALQETLTDRFESFKHDFFINIEWIDPRNWLEDRNYGIPMIEFLSERFKRPLANKGFDSTKALTEFKQFRIFVKQFTVQNSSQVPSHQKKCGTKLLLYVNRSFIGEIMLSISG